MTKTVRVLALTTLVIVAWMAGPSGEVTAAAARRSSQVHTARTAERLPFLSGTGTRAFLFGGARGHAAIAAGGINSNLSVFIRGLDDALWHDEGDSQALNWSGWQSLGGGLLSAPAAASWGPGRIDVFAIGLDRAMWHIAWTGSGWSSWQSLGGGFLSGPTASSWTTNVLDVEAVGLDHAMWHSRWDGSHWTQWESLGGGFTSDPAAVSPALLRIGTGFDRVDLYARGLDGQMYRDTRCCPTNPAGPSWGGWQPLFGGFNSGPGVTNTSQRRLIWALGLDWNLYCNDEGGSGWVREPIIFPTHLDPALPTTGQDVIAIVFVQDDATVAIATFVPDIPPEDC